MTATKWKLKRHCYTFGKKSDTTSILQRNLKTYSVLWQVIISFQTPDAVSTTHVRFGANTALCKSGFQLPTLCSCCFLKIMEILSPYLFHQPFSHFTSSATAFCSEMLDTVTWVKTTLSVKPAIELHLSGQNKQGVALYTSALLS